MYIFYGDVVWSNGKDGGYLVLGNMVYTVNTITMIQKQNLLKTLILVCCCNCLSKSRTYNKLMDMVDALFNLGFYIPVVYFHVSI